MNIESKSSQKEIKIKRKKERKTNENK